MSENYVAMLKILKSAVAVSMLFVSGLACSQMNAQSAFAAGKSAGADNVEGVINLISLIKAGESVKDFSPSPPTQSSYWAGQGTVLNTLVSGGNSRVNECSTTGLSTTDPKDKQHCEAVNAIQDVHTNKPTNIISAADPLLVRGNLITSDPEAIAGVMNSTYSGCTTTTLTTPGATVEQTCNYYKVHEINEEDAKDHAQQLFINIIDNIGKFKLDAKFNSRFYCMMRNELVDSKRKETKNNNRNLR